MSVIEIYEVLSFNFTSSRIDDRAAVSQYLSEFENIELIGEEDDCLIFFYWNDGRKNLKVDFDGECLVISPMSFPM